MWFFGSSYIIPNIDTVVLGGTAGKGDWSTAVSLQDTETILSNIEKVFPSIRDAPIVSISQHCSTAMYLHSHQSLQHL